jgi:lysophospholipase L1-like esterase
MHERPTRRVVMVLSTAIVAAVVGCAAFILFVPAVPKAPNQYVAANFVIEVGQGAARPHAAAAPPIPDVKLSPVNQARILPDPASDKDIQTALLTTDDRTGSVPTAAPAPDSPSLDLVSTATAVPKLRQPPQAVRILQIGDSHTAADFFSGELRRRLQMRFGVGGAGYLAAGKPHLGVRSDIVKVNTSSGWTYQALQKSEDVSQFWLSGFNAVSTTPGNTITYTSDTPMRFDSIELEAVRQPKGGTVEVRLDGTLEGAFDLSGAAVEPIVFRLRPKQKPVEKFRRLELRTTGGGPVVISSIGIYNSHDGLSLSSVGFPGATVSLLNKFAPNLLADDLRRIDPQVVILAFGTNEASNDKLSQASYAATYEGVINKIKAALPAASIVIVGPADGEERGSKCKGATEQVCHGANANEAASTGTPDCAWHRLPKLSEVRSAQQDIATRRKLSYWNWASIMPEDCGAHSWVTAEPPLMTPDHIHFTHAGYAKAADQLLPTITAVIENLPSAGKAASTE